MLYPDEIIEEVRVRNDIVDVISEYAGLKKAGNSYKCCCPFHNEKTPSFTVSREKQMYHCFGCGAGGNVYTFIMKYENLTFPEAIQFLAKRVGITLPERELSPADRAKADRRTAMFEVNRVAAAYFHFLLTKTEAGGRAYKYYKDRGYTDETIKKFGLGYAEIYSDDLYKYLKKREFKDEIIPVTVPQGRKKPPIVFDTDEFVKRDTSLEKMAKLKPCFNITTDEDGKIFNSSELTGTVTAASSSGRNDGASCVLLMTEEKAKELGLKPICRIIGMGTAGADPRTMGLGPVYAVPKALKNAGLTMDDIQLIELNEAFAAQALGCIKELHWEDKMDIINVNGGAIAMGHPVGSSGCRILVTLMYEMKRRGLKYGLATLCIAGGMGQATVIEMCD